MDKLKELKKLKGLFDNGIITKEEFNDLKSEILGTNKTSPPDIDDVLEEKISKEIIEDSSENIEFEKKKNSIKEKVSFIEKPLKTEATEGKECMGDIPSTTKEVSNNDKSKGSYTALKITIVAIIFLFLVSVVGYVFFFSKNETDNDKPISEGNIERTTKIILKKIGTSSGYIWESVNNNAQIYTTLAFEDKVFHIISYKMNGSNSNLTKLIDVEGKWSVIDLKLIKGVTNVNNVTVTWVFSNDYSFVTNNKNVKFKRREEEKSNTPQPMKLVETENQNNTRNNLNTGVINGTDIIIRNSYSSNSQIIGSFKDSGERVEIVDLFNPKNKSESILVEDFVSDSIKLLKGKAITVLSENNGTSIVTFKDKELTKHTLDVPSKYLEKISNQKWYKVKRKSGEIGWVYGKYLMLDREVLNLINNGNLEALPLAIPKGWRIPNKNDMFGDWEVYKKDDYVPYYFTSDFDQNGLLDEAWVLIKNDGTSFGIWGLLRTKDSQLNYLIKEEESFKPQYIGIDKMKIGTYKTACGKGYYDCGPGEPSEVKITSPQIWYSPFGSGGAFLFLWDKNEREFRKYQMND